MSDRTGREEPALSHLPWLIQTQGFRTVTLNLDQEGYVEHCWRGHSSLQVRVTNLLMKPFQKEVTSSPRGLFTNLIQNSYEPELITIYLQHSWTKHHLTIPHVSTKPDNIQLFHLFTHKHVIYKIHVVGIFVLLLLYFTSSFQRSPFSNYFRELLVAFWT